jgi:pimeloyl-ACP methyl ester carboxylesterase
MPNPPNFVFVHGSGCISDIWVEQVTFLSHEFQARALNLPGRSDQDFGYQNFTFPGFVAFLKAKLKEMKAPVVVGHSLGAAVALELYLESPESLRALVLVGIAKQAHISDQLIHLLQNDYEAALRKLPRGLLSSSADSAAQDRLISVTRRVPVATFINDLKISQSFNFERRLGPADKPILIIQGADDRVTPARDGRELARELNADFKEVGASGHMVMIEQPRHLNECLRQFAGTLI